MSRTVCVIFAPTITRWKPQLLSITCVFIIPSWAMVATYSLVRHATPLYQLMMKTQIVSGTAASCHHHPSLQFVDNIQDLSSSKKLESQSPHNLNEILSSDQVVVTPELILYSETSKHFCTLGYNLYTQMMSLLLHLSSASPWTHTLVMLKHKLDTF